MKVETLQDYFAHIRYAETCFCRRNELFKKYSEYNFAESMFTTIQKICFFTILQASAEKMKLDGLFKIKFCNFEFFVGQQMLSECCLNFSVDPRDAMDSLYDINRNRNTVFRGVLKPPVLVPTLELPPIFIFLFVNGCSFHFEWYVLGSVII